MKKLNDLYCICKELTRCSKTAIGAYEKAHLDKHRAGYGLITHINKIYNNNYDRERHELYHLGIERGRLWRIKNH